MLLNSMAAACMQFIWVMVCIPNHIYVSGKSELKDLHAHILLHWTIKRVVAQIISVDVILLPEAAVAV